MQVLKKKRKEQADISAANQVFNDFFLTKPKNAKGENWFNPDDASCLLPNEIKEVCESLQTFFQRKKWYNGGQIPHELLFTKRNFRLINNIALFDAVELAYACIEQCKSLFKTTYKKNVDTLITMKVIRDCEAKGIPQDHIGGLLLLYLELCERVVLL